MHICSFLKWVQTRHTLFPPSPSTAAADFLRIRGEKTKVVQVLLSQKQKERLDADRQVNKEENVIQAPAGYVELSKRCELREGLTSLWVEVSSSFAPPPQPEQVQLEAPALGSNDLNDSHRKLLQTD